MSHLGGSTVTSKGQITLPASLRDRFDIRPGDLVEFFEGYDGAIKMRVRGKSAAALTGLLAHLRPDPRYATDDDAIAAEVAARDERSKCAASDDAA
ncbi:AbrB/MazE/SpoVT family DNA-binding domain-containing protein [Chelatococcus sp. SYSU_G07232]|uniref:AbrB/MazE/SpoVT family DNA-binding domain-containing protein n=1 Tax=Chelatococcus albus TaxID=3047466 RepID=A0ABT7AK60_9HYPH|nr:AbrB/MazE/SpoVT family DNA-binding domain-containing protein [Chelatococcus sp. SYSU_G07232]MDJ1158981.1 AbrB/MazE/SpoVT family DNA-binding domain-containing protein [Chelatococcus sp. SYSU_G07232]